jgi:uncharacterized membrane protein
MSELIAITFDGADDATAALASVRALEHAGKLGLEDTAVVTKAADGKIHVKNEMATGTETGAVVGAILGSLLFVVFPVGAIVGGAVIGGLIGRAVKPGIDGTFVKQVETDLPAGGSALFVLTKGGEDVGLLIAAMRQYHGRVVQTSLDEEEEQALRDSLT